MTDPLVGVIMGSRSDWETMRHAARDARRRSACRTRSASSRRTARRTCCSSTPAPRRRAGLEVDHRRRRRRGAPARDGGGEDDAPGARRAGRVARRSQGMDSLLSIVQMPAGVPVGTLAIGRAGAVNAALLAAAIVGRHDAGDPRGAAPLPRGPDAAPCSTTPTRADGAHGVRVGDRSAAGSSGACSALAGYPLGLRFRFLDPSPDALRRRRSASCIVGGLRRRGRARPLRRRRRRRDLRVRERAGRAAAARETGAGATRHRGARDRAGPAAEKELLPRARDPDRALRGGRRPATLTPRSRRSGCRRSSRPGGSATTARASSSRAGDVDAPARRSAACR